ncbi:hypothetical protein QQ045_017849 [Rhodiola kirilowii]
MEWDFLEEIRRRMGFPELWIRKIMACVRTVAYRVKINDIISDVFSLERGIRQGDPLSPYLFVLGMEWLAQRLDEAQQSRYIQGLKSESNEVYGQYFGDEGGEFHREIFRPSHLSEW